MSTPSIEDVLLEHERQMRVSGAGLVVACKCGEPLLSKFSSRIPVEADFRAHLADAIRAHLAEHTDEAAGAVERVRALADDLDARADQMGPKAGGLGFPDIYRNQASRIRAALAGGASGAAEGADR